SALKSDNASSYRLGKTLRGYDRQAVDALVSQKDNELADLRGQLRHQRELLTEAESERRAFMRSLEVAARAADELLEDAENQASQIRDHAAASVEVLLAETERTVNLTSEAAHAEATELIEVTRADLADYDAIERERISLGAQEAAQIVEDAEADRDALATYQQELSNYLEQLGHHLIAASIDPTIARPIAEQPAFTGTSTSEDDLIVLSEVEEGDFDEFFSDDIAHDKARDWILEK
ncbi:MAG: hypothetical protein V3V01_20890, partial [Acidimicrobiales bacterium]